MSSMKNDKLLSLSCCAHNNTLRKKYPKTQYGVVSTTKPKQLNALVNRLLPEQKTLQKDTGKMVCWSRSKITMYTSKLDTVYSTCGEGADGLTLIMIG